MLFTQKYSIENDLHCNWFGSGTRLHIYVVCLYQCVGGCLMPLFTTAATVAIVKKFDIYICTVDWCTYV